MPEVEDREQYEREVAELRAVGKVILPLVAGVLLFGWWFGGWFGTLGFDTYAAHNDSSDSVSGRNIYPMSESRTENGLRFTLQEAEWGDREHLPDPRSGAEFVGYRMTVTNASDGPLTYWALDQRLLVAGNEFKSADVGFYEANGLERLNPGLSADVYLAFEVPENVDMSDARLLFEGSSYAVFAGF